MKVGIITWYKEINHGAALQAYSTQQFLRDRGIDAVLLDHERSCASMDDRLGERLKRWSKKLHPLKALTAVKARRWNESKRVRFAEFREHNFCQGKNYAENQGLDAAIVGSDMVFDFYEGYNPYMYGRGVAAPQLLAYAASFGYTTAELLDNFEKKDEIADLLSSFAAVGCRDDNTIDLVRRLAPSSEVTKTVDPVLLYGFEREREIWGKEDSKEDRPYILIYSYPFNMDDRHEIEAIRELAHRTNCKIVSVGYYHPWCDENRNADPEEFVRLFSDAEYVVTDTYHGVVFSLLFEKQFRTVVRRNAFKVCDLLKEVGGEDLIISCPADIVSMPEDRIDYNTISVKIDSMRRKSAQFLLGQLQGIENAL